ncbi:MAG: hypothetical protein WCF12_07175, partial [Propionicimonas sp.]
MTCRYAGEARAFISPNMPTIADRAPVYPNHHEHSLQRGTVRGDSELGAASVGFQSFQRDQLEILRGCTTRDHV